MKKLLSFKGRGRLVRVYGKSLIQYGSIRKIVNAVRTELAYRRRDPVVKSKPYILFLEPLYYCNLECPLCDRQVFPDARKGDAGKLSIEQYQQVLDEVGDYLFQCQIFGQGEPTLDWERTKKIIQMSKARRIFTLMSTNCTLITPEMADSIVTSGLDHCVVAIDGMSQESYEVYRVGGEVEKALGGLRLIAEARKRHNASMEIEWQFLVHKHNAHEVEAAKKFAADLGVFIRFAPLRGMDWDEEKESFWLGSDHPLEWKRTDPGSTSRPYACYFLWRSLVLNSNFKIARCLIYQNITQYADLRKMSVMDAYNHPTQVRARQLFAPKGSKNAPPANAEFPQPCTDCPQFERHHGPPNRTKRTPLPMLKSDPIADPVPHTNLV